MASVAWHIMDTAHKRRQKLVSEGRYEEAFVWDDLESAVNNVHHGLHHTEYLPRVLAIFADREDHPDQVRQVREVVRGYLDRDRDV